MPTPGGIRDAARSLRGGGGWVLFAALLSVNVGNLLFHSLASHLLGPEGYGAVASILSILLAVSVPVSAAQVALTGEVARRMETGQEATIAPLVRRFVFGGCAAAVGFLLLSPALAAYLHLDSLMPLVWLALYLIPLSAGVVPWASLVGRRRFGAVAAAVSAGTALRIGVGAAVLAAGGGVAGAMAATFVSEVAIAGALLVQARPLRSEGHPPLELRWDVAFRGTVAVAGLWVLVAMDTILARHYLSPLDAGTYAAASMAARGALYLPQAIAAVALPSLATANAEQAGRALTHALLAAGALGIVAVAALTLASPALLPIVFGAGFQASPVLVALLALAATGAGLLNVLVQYSIVQRSQAAAAWVGVVTLPLLVLLSHGGPRSVAIAALLAMALALVTALGGVRRRRRLAARPALSGARLAAASEVDLTVVVPFHRAGEPLRRTLLSLVEALERAGVRFEVIAVADGCGEEGLTLPGPGGHRVRCVALDRRYGKGAALRAGLREGRGEYLGFIDSDGDLDPALWEPFLTLMRMYRPDAVVGSKRHPLSEVRSPGVRRLYSRGYQALVQLLFRLPVRDTQVGIKLFRRELLVDVLPRTIERGFVFDLELLVAARRLGYRRLLEAPVALDGREESTVRPGTVWRMMLETLAVAWRLRTGRYDPIGEEASRPPLPLLRGSQLPAPAPVARGAELTG